eukprot:Selendium_serpulae@DN2747_c0_g1_i2.p1
MLVVLFLSDSGDLRKLAEEFEFQDKRLFRSDNIDPENPREKRRQRQPKRIKNSIQMDYKTLVGPCDTTIFSGCRLVTPRDSFGSKGFKIQHTTHSKMNESVNQKLRLTV